MAQCPAEGHDDRTPSLSVGQGDTGAVLCCQRGCDTEAAILPALSLAARDLFDQPGTKREALPFRVVTEYKYTAEDGELLFVKERREPKDFRCKRPDGAGGWTWKLGTTRRVLYRLPDVLAAIREGRTVYVVEGERDADRLARLGVAATCNYDGAAEEGQRPKWRAEYGDTLSGADVVIIADRDSAGLAHARAALADLSGKAKSAAILLPAVETEHADVSDHLGSGFTMDQLLPLAGSAAAEVAPDSGEPVPDSGEDLSALAEIAGRYTPVDWRQAWEGQPEDIDWLYGEFLERGTLSALFAKPGTGKSLIALELAVAIVRSGGTVVYIDHENRVADLVDRLQAFGCDYAELTPRLALYSFADLPPLDSAIGGTHLLALAVANGADLVILDTTTRLVAGRENDSDTFLQLYRCSLVPLKSRGITALRLDHPGKDAEKGQRGSSAKDGDVDCIWRLSAVTDGIEYRLEREKLRGAPMGRPGMFTLRRRYEPLRHEWDEIDETTCPPNDLQIKIIGQLDAQNVPLTAGRDVVRKILAGHGIKAGNAQVSAAIKLRRANPGIVRDSLDSANAERTAIPDDDQLDMFGNPAYEPVPDSSGTARTAPLPVPASPPLGGDSGQGTVQACEFCGEPHLRFGAGARPCTEAALTRHYHQTRREAS